MQIVIFTYNREKKLKRLLKLLTGYQVIIVDDGSEWSKDHSKRPKDCTYIRTPHDGKEGMWRNLLVAHEVALSSPHDYFLFIADDVIPKMEIFEKLVKQGWDNNLFTIAPTNTGRYEEWGRYRTNHIDFHIDNYKFVETGFCDLGMFTNRLTLEAIRIDQVPAGWFNTPGKSSGVGAQQTRKFRELGVAMLTTIPSISKHGKHKSVMHEQHRKDNPMVQV